MSSYRLYTTAVATIKIKSCAECPGRRAQRYLNAGKFSTGYVCGLINERKIAHYPDGDKEITINPSVKEAVESNGILYNCPLPKEII